MSEAAERVVKAWAAGATLAAAGREGGLPVERATREARWYLLGLPDLDEYLRAELLLVGFRPRKALRAALARHFAGLVR